MSIIGISFWIAFLISAGMEIFGFGSAAVHVLFLFIDIRLLGIGVFNGTLFVRTPKA